MMMLLEQRGAEVQITEAVVKAAASNEENGKELMVILFNSFDDLTISTAILEAASTCGQEEVLDYLEEVCHFIIWDSNLRAKAKLYAAAKTGDEATVKDLLAAGVSPDSRNTRGVTPLWVAASKGHARIVQCLLETEGEYPDAIYYHTSPSAAEKIDAIGNRGGT